MNNTVAIIEEIKNGKIDFNAEIYRAAFALNLCTVSVSQIIDYDDVVVLEQEYEAILNNLNIENMPKDEALLNILKQLLDTITFFRIQDGDKQFIDREYQNQMKNAIWSAVPNFGLIVAGGNVASMAVSLATQVGIGYMNYRKAKSENAFAYEKNMWQLQRAAIEQFNGLRRELFDTAWRLVDAHDVPDEYRLTERQVKQYNEILMDSDVLRRYERLDTIKENFIAYPPFWYHFGNTANLLSNVIEDECAKQYRELAKVYYEIFIQSFKACNLLRENQVASACALEYIDLLNVNKVQEKTKMVELLEFAVRMSGNANDVLQLCAFAYLKIGDSKNASIILRRLVNENYNAIVNAQILSGYYVCQHIAGDGNAKAGYRYLKNRIDEAYLFPFPNAKLIESEEKDTLETIQSKFIRNQKEILAKKYGLVINYFREKYRILFNRCVPVPEGKKYTDAYFDNSNESFEARKVDGMCLKNKKNLNYYMDDLLDCDYPYNYLIVLNDMINATDVLNCLQGCGNKLVKSVSEAIVAKSKFLKSLRDKIEDPLKFNVEVYNEILEVSFDEYTADFFEFLTIQVSRYIDAKNDIISMNEAEMNLREFCIQQGFEMPDIIYETANDILEECRGKRQYLGIELIDEGNMALVVNDQFDSIRNKVQLYADKLCLDKTMCSFIMCDEEEFERYFIRLGILNKQGIRRKTVAILDDMHYKNKDLLFTTEGVVQILKGKVIKAVPYDDIELNSEKNEIIIRTPYTNKNVNMTYFVEMIMGLRTKPFAIVKDKKNPIEMIAGIMKK